MSTQEVPLGHSTPAHRVHGWCSHCPDRSVEEELGAWQVDAMDRLREEASENRPAFGSHLREQIRLAIDGYPKAAWTSENLAGRIVRVLESETAPLAPADRVAEWEAERAELNWMIRSSNAAAADARQQLAAVTGDRAAVLREAADAAAGVQPPGFHA